MEQNAVGYVLKVTVMVIVDN